MDSKQHIDNVIENKIRKIFEMAASEIDAIPEGGKIPATVLAEKIADSFNMTGPQLYPTLLFLFNTYPGIEIKRGAHGGLYKLPKPKAVEIKTTEVSVESTPNDSNEENV